MKALFLLTFATLLAGCASIPKGHDVVSAGVERRTGHRVVSAPPGQFQPPRGVALSLGLSEDQAVSVALCNNALFLETLADLGVARAEVVQAGVVPNPSLVLLFPSGAKQLEFTARLASEILWLRPMRVRVAKLDYERTAEQLVQNGLNLVRDVKLAYTEAVAAEQRLALAEEATGLAAKIEALARARITAGDASELEVNTAGVDTLQGRELVARSRQEVAIARERLRAAVGLSYDRRPIGGLAQGRLRQVRPAPDALVKLALASRPDLRAAEIALEAAGRRRGIATAEIFTISAIFDGNRVNTPTNGGSGSRQRIETGPGLDVGIPIFNQNQGGRARQDAAFEKAARGYISVRERIALEVREALLRYQQAQTSYQLWSTKILPPLEEAVRQSQEAYQAGNTPILLVLESSRKLTDARGRRVTAETEVRRALAELERAIGGRLPG